MTAARPSVLDTMRQATPLVRQVTLCLEGELQAEYDALQKQLVEASVHEDSLAQEGITRVASQMERIHKQMAAAEVTFSFRALSWLDDLTLKAEHPPRDGDLRDRMAGFNVETYPTALLRATCASVMGADKKVVTEIPDEVWDEMLAGGLTGAPLKVLQEAALQANETVTTVPPSARSLLDSLASGASSKSQGPGTSPRNASKGGSRRGSRKSTATKKAASSG